MSVIQLDTGDALLVDAIGAQAVRLYPAEQVGLILDLEGKLNKLRIRDAHRYVLTVATAAELIAELIVTATEAAAHLAGGSEFAAELDAAILNEQRRRGLTS